MTLSKEQLVTKVMATEFQRKAGWRSYYQAQDNMLTDRISSVREIRTIVESDDTKRLKQMLLNYIDKYESEKLECPICQDKPEKKDATITSCGHLMCTPCLKEWTKTSKTCPMCRANIHPGSSSD